jgi:nucleotide-binding universal stress UspA family protein
MTRQTHLSSTDLSVGLGATPSQRGGIKQVLAYVDGTESDRAVLDQALTVALRFESHIDVLHVRLDVRGASMGKGYQRYADHLLDVPIEHAVTEAAAHAHRHFEEWQTQCKLPLRETGMAIHDPSTLWREIVGYESDIIARLGRLSDLIVITRPSARSSSSSLMALETALFDTCRPVLMVPDGAPMNLFHRPIIAWNGSLEAARAVGFALPFLSECEGSVGVFAAPERKHSTETEELQRYLSWHGIVAERISFEDPRPIGMCLLAQASANQAGLIIMGAYTHGHYRQFLFGGVTRYVMEHAAIPILLAH